MAVIVIDVGAVPVSHPVRHCRWSIHALIVCIVVGRAVFQIVEIMCGISHVNCDV